MMNRILPNLISMREPDVSVGAGANRIYWVDTAKALGIFFIFYGHLDAIDENVRTYVFSFHVPLFFFLSGMFMKDSRLTVNFRQFIADRLKRRIWPYFTFGILTYFLWILLLVLKRYNIYQGKEIVVHPIKPLIGMFYGNGTDNWLSHNQLLWFLACLFSIEIILYLIRRCTNNNILILLSIFTISLLGYINSLTDHPRLPFGFDVALVAVLYYGVGYVAKDFIVKFRFNIYFAFLLLIVGMISSYINGKIDMNFNVYGNYLLFVLSSFCGIIFWCELSKRVKEIGIIQYIGRNTLSIFLLQSFSFLLINGILRFVLHLPTGYHDPYFIPVIYSLCSILLLIPFVYIINRYLPFLVRKK